MVHNPQDTQFSVMEDKKTLKIFTFQKLESENLDLDNSNTINRFIKQLVNK